MEPVTLEQLEEYLMDYMFCVNGLVGEYIVDFDESTIRITDECGSLEWIVKSATIASDGSVCTQNDDTIQFYTQFDPRNA